MKRDYKAASGDFERVINKTVSDTNYKTINIEEFFDDGVVETIRHALQMMQKLQEPSEGMLKEIEFQCNCAIPSASYAVKAMLEQAELEINQPKGD